MNNKKRAVQTIAIILVFVITLFSSRTVLSQTESTFVYVDPGSSTATTCSTQMIAIQVQDVVDLTGYHLEVSFDPTVIEVTGVVNGDFLAPPGENALYEPTNEIDNVNGLIRFGMVQQGDGTGNPIPKSGDGVLIEITLHALVPNQTSPIDIDSENSSLVNWPDVQAIEFTAADGVVTTESCAPTGIALTDYHLPENEPIGTEIGTFITIDPDMPDDSFTYELVSGIGDNDNASFEIIGSSLQSKEKYNYEEKFIYYIRVRSTDLGDKTIEKTFLIFIVDANDPPVAFDQDVFTEEEVPVEIILTAFDEDGDDLDYEIISSPSEGLLTGSAPDLTYTPGEDFIGFDSFTFRVYDGQSYSELATVSILIDAKKGVDYYYPLFMHNN